jgi:hypothetical protein
MENNYKLKIKIGMHEFEADGPADTVREQFESFKQLITSMPNQSTPLTQNSPVAGEFSGTIPATAQDVAFDDSQLGKIMKKEARVVSLTIRPQSVEQALLLIILGQRYLRNMEVTTGGEIMAGISSTGGLTVTRIDRFLEKMGREGDLIVAGEHRSKRYRFTNSGLIKAQKIAKELLATVA